MDEVVSRLFGNLSDVLLDVEDKERYTFVQIHSLNKRYLLIKATYYIIGF